jgi:hypothetical protein
MNVWGVRPGSTTVANALHRDVRDQTRPATTSIVDLGLSQRRGWTSAEELKAGPRVNCKAEMPNFQLVTQVFFKSLPMGPSEGSATYMPLEQAQWRLMYRDLTKLNRPNNDRTAAEKYKDTSK